MGKEEHTKLLEHHQSKCEILHQLLQHTARATQTFQGARAHHRAPCFLFLPSKATWKLTKNKGTASFKARQMWIKAMTPSA